VDNIKVSNVGQ